MKFSMFAIPLFSAILILSNCAVGYVFDRINMIV